MEKINKANIILANGEEISEKEHVKKIFAPVISGVSELKEKIEKIEIVDDTILQTAKNYHSTIKDCLKAIEEKRKEIKDPVVKMGKEIDNYAKLITEPLTLAIDHCSNKIVAYQNLQAAIAEQKAKEAEEKLREKEKKAEEKAALLERIVKQLYARLLGGSYKVGSGEERRSSGCSTLTHIEELKKFFREEAPPTSIFEDFEDEAKKAYQSYQIDIDKYAKILVEMDDKSEEVRAAARESLLELKDRVGIEMDRTEDKLKKNIEEKGLAQEKAIKNQISGYEKGITKTIKYSVSEEKSIPRKYLTVDEKKINEYKKKYRKEILEACKKGQELIPGIHFYVEQSARKS